MRLVSVRVIWWSLRDVLAPPHVEAVVPSPTLGVRRESCLAVFYAQVRAATDAGNDVLA